MTAVTEMLHLKWCDFKKFPQNTHRVVRSVPSVQCVYVCKVMDATQVKFNQHYRTNISEHGT